MSGDARGGVTTRRAVAALLAASVLAGSGCSAPRPLPEPASEEQAGAYAQRNLDVLWSVADVHQGTPRPEVERVRFITAKEWAAVTARCMNDAGYPEYRRNGGGIRSNVAAERAADAALAMFVCQAQYPIDPRGQTLFSDDELDYLYDYFIQWLIPCLEFQGHHISGIPERADFRRQWESYRWSPYSSVSIPYADEVTDRLREACGPYPAGFFE